MKYTVTMEVIYRKVVTVDSISKPYAERDAKTVIYQRCHDDEIVRSIEVLNTSEIKTGDK
jgi:hypothetical protein